MLKILKRGRFLISPVIIGILVSIGPILFWPVLLILFLGLESFRIWRHGFMPDGPIRIALIASIMMVATYLPTKYVDQEISIETIEIMLGNNASSIKLDSAYLLFPGGFDVGEVEFGRGKTTIKKMIREVEAQTGLVHSIGYCGTGMNLLYGGHPIGGIRFVPNKERN